MIDQIVKLTLRLLSTRKSDPHALRTSRARSNSQVFLCWKAVRWSSNWSAFGVILWTTLRVLVLARENILTEPERQQETRTCHEPEVPITCSI